MKKTMENKIEDYLQKMREQVTSAKTSEEENLENTRTQDTLGVNQQAIMGNKEGVIFVEKLQDWNKSQGRNKRSPR